MKWKEKFKNECDIGEMIIEERFLWFPMCINGEYRWLERVKYWRKLKGVASGVSFKHPQPWWDNQGWKNF